MSSLQSFKTWKCCRELDNVCHNLGWAAKDCRLRWWQIRIETIISVVVNFSVRHTMHCRRLAGFLTILTSLTSPFGCPAHPGRLSSHLVEGFQRFRLMSFRQSPDSCYFVAWAFHLSVCLLSNAIVLFALELFIPCNINRVYLIVLAKTIAKRISSII